MAIGSSGVSEHPTAIKEAKTNKKLADLLELEYIN
ncbi:hypothetical protein CRENPOLYSF1_180039 [Crenothrix polyspora]|uniref:Uncharacterized protein n=1 Tax=Crenothrix polyspora TaxID=360316 RepID=A0A1R4H5S6_9GAMM|nr:hypothetical protein CRENPOLYSF1_180039 [Crenothrix polyspora]